MVLEQFVGSFLKLFGYNRSNFQNDRKQRQIMEYDLSGFRIKQTDLWRDDIRDIVMLTPQKMEVYLLIIALELGFCVMALCKGRVKPGAPPWLVACHTISVCGALMYLFMALWFAMHAFVSSVAYKARILTQLVRQPIPTWDAMEASRTYSSAFEKQGVGQMLRVPFAMGSQEQQRRQLDQQQDLLDGAALPAGGADAQATPDPWGLERCGESIPELSADVNESTAKQRHIWLAREAARFYQTYDAFARICMSAGTSSLATFFCYFSLSYVLTENAAPAPAWGGMCIFCSCAVVLLRMDLMLKGRQYATLIFLMVLSPVLSAVVTFVSSKNRGIPGNWEFLMPIAVFSHGAWLLYYVWCFRATEVSTGIMLPSAFRAVLFLDAFGQSKHSGGWRRRFARQQPSSSQLDGAMPSMECADTAVPSRPEDVGKARWCGFTPSGYPEAVAASRQGAIRREESGMGGVRSGAMEQASFRPHTFAAVSDDHEDEDEPALGQTGANIHAERPGAMPWRVFMFSTCVLAGLWWYAAGIALYNAFNGSAVFVQANYVPLQDGMVLPMAELIGTRVETNWGYALARPRGFTCDPEGLLFATLGTNTAGHQSLLHARLSERDGALAMRFAPASCSLDEVSQVQDLSMHGCHTGRGCSALLLPRRGKHFISCPMLKENGQRHELPLRREWLDDRGGAALDGEHHPEGLLLPEEVASVGLSPCARNGGGDTENCIVVGTTSHRIVQLANDRGVGGDEATWAPRHLLHEDHGEVPGPGAFALLGRRHLGVLRRNTSELRVLDLEQGGATVGTWQLPAARGDGDASTPGRWASVCSGGGALYALEDRENPALWRFAAPAHAQLEGSHPKSAQLLAALLRG